MLKILEKYLYGSLGPVGYIDECAADFNEIFIRIFERGNNLSYIAVDIETEEVYTKMLNNSSISNCHVLFKTVR